MGLKDSIKSKAAKGMEQIKNAAIEGGKKAGNAITTLSKLSPSQLEDIKNKQNLYLSGKPDPCDKNNEEQTKRLLDACGAKIYRTYLTLMKDLYLPIEEAAHFPDESNNPIEFAKHNIRIFNITKWVTDKSENSLIKLVNVYEVLSKEKCNISLIFHRKQCSTDVYLSVTNTEKNKENSNTAVNNLSGRLKSAVHGNFPGSEFQIVDEKNFPFLDDDVHYTIATVSNLPNEKSKDFISQTIDKLLDGIQPESDENEYTIILMATPVLDVNERKTEVAQLYSALYPYSQWSTSYTYVQNDSSGSSASVSLNVGVSAGSQTSTSVGGAAGVSLPIGPAVSGFVSGSLSNSIGFNAGLGLSRSSMVTATIGKNEGISQNFMNYDIKHALEMLDVQMRRLEQSSALGLWDFAAYILCKSPDIANNVAHSYLALTQGEESYLSQSSISLWYGNQSNEYDKTREIYRYLRKLKHPVFGLNPEIVSDETIRVLSYPVEISATSALSGKELAYSLNFPARSISGLPVIQCAEFGRDVVSYGSIAGKEIIAGNIFHMNHEEIQRVSLSLDSLTSHVFVSGSTGSGKTNTILHIISEAHKQGIAFLIVEPAKGEYKTFLGKNTDVSVYGTNPSKMPLLRINPFSFPEDIHVLEHLDRLVEIFNACWPLYAAMPAVLKSAIEKSYQDAGWDLLRSVNKYRVRLFPSFSDVSRNIRKIIDESEYDSENKGAYKGSLLTRLQALSSGLNGMIFSDNEISDVDLFDRNVIVDLSRVGASETKSLIMGMLVLKLQEYRLSFSSEMNAGLHHITVMEEAHNLLRRVSADISSDSGNLAGKSVEMLSNAIAEMRAYGEGFIIADQAPGLLDLSVIRNTNTKIIMRLPDLGDRELVGRAANLKDDQIEEIAKLPCGVAAIYQNEWIQPVLCKIKKYQSSAQGYSYYMDNQLNYDDTEITNQLLDCIARNEIFRKGGRRQIREMEDRVLRSSLKLQTKICYFEYLAADEATQIKKLGSFVYSLVDGGKILSLIDVQIDSQELIKDLLAGLPRIFNDFSIKERNLIFGLLFREHARYNPEYIKLYSNFMADHAEKEGVL